MRIPLYIEMSDKNVLIIGGGGVGTSRAKKFISAGANVKVLSLDFSDELKSLEKENKLELIKASAYDSNILEKLLEWANIVTVATEDLGVNDVVKKIARNKKCFLNFANDSRETEVVVPFEGEFEGIKFAVTTEGKSGVVARMVRDSILEMLKKDDEIISLLKAMDYLKRYMKSEKVPVDLRMKLYFEVSSDEKFRNLVREGKVEEAKLYAEELVKEYSSGKRKFRVKSSLNF
ncbi:siroheme synthase, N-terminal domain protein [Archaeoglobus sulfaticallidus PM70-1]|uniref:precorrin-2 dehydrogenase n=1 Tax=Archaeoglobus sulfaticallidus PM70-1 TaxID=387631 RepID=N0BKD5_9EURY|nr:bifunctional precorrin-2 dehydrogenase/sirohydrochlorin ferrochelatase [Archaeoglobus sulfaticallidus]AGK60630.1 siroheme synthase, N-terminal domain protein [Archaeoglobus sulfaticallidus PM70-1]